MTRNVPVSTLKPGDKILPPARELRLWMRRHAADHGMTDNALILTVVTAEPARVDKLGPWWRITAEHDPEWTKDEKGPHARAPFRFLARPHTLWPCLTQ